MTNMSLGKIGEDIALQFLLKNGFTLLTRNYRTRYGEIDIIVKKGNRISFVEVKTRKNITKGMPYEAVTYYKKKHLEKAAYDFLLKNKYKDCKLSLDVISLLLEDNNTVKQLQFFEYI